MYCFGGSDYILMRHRSPYLAAGVISARECVRATVALSESKKPSVDASRDTGVGRWVQELGACTRKHR